MNATSSSGGATHPPAARRRGPWRDSRTPTRDNQPTPWPRSPSDPWPRPKPRPKPPPRIIWPHPDDDPRHEQLASYLARHHTPQLDELAERAAAVEARASERAAARVGAARALFASAKRYARVRSRGHS